MYRSKSLEVHLLDNKKILNTLKTLKSQLIMVTAHDNLHLLPILNTLALNHLARKDNYGSYIIFHITDMGIEVYRLKISDEIVSWTIGAGVMCCISAFMYALACLQLTSTPLVIVLLLMVLDINILLLKDAGHTIRLSVRNKAHRSKTVLWSVFPASALVIFSLITII